MQSVGHLLYQLAANDWNLFAHGIGNVGSKFLGKVIDQNGYEVPYAAFFNKIVC